MQLTAMKIDVNNGPLLLPATLDLAAAEGFLELVRHRVNDEAPLRIDASQVEAITLPCIRPMSPNSARLAALSEAFSSMP